MRNIFCAMTAMIWLVWLCMLPTLTPDNAGDEKADMGTHARARQRTKKKSAQKEQRASQAESANATKHCK